MTWEMLAVFLGSSLRLATPLLLGAIGELVSERAGVLNMSIEGMMLTAALAGAVGAWATGSPVTSRSTTGRPASTRAACTSAR